MEGMFREKSEVIRIIINIAKSLSQLSNEKNKGDFQDKKKHEIITAHQAL